MKKFYAVGTDKDGKKYAGSFEAVNEPEARRLLDAEGYTILTLEELGPAEPAEAVLKKKAAPAPRDPSSGEKPAGPVRIGSGKERPAGLGTAFLAAAALLALLLVVMGILYRRREKPEQVPAVSGVSAAPAKTPADGARHEEAAFPAAENQIVPDTEGGETTVEAVAAEVQITDSTDAQVTNTEEEK